MTQRKTTAQAKRIIVKIGSAMLTEQNRGLFRERMGDWAKQIASLKDKGKQVVLVSSGAVAEGMVRMNLVQTPTRVSLLQAIAAIGQIGLARAWEEVFEHCQCHSAQVLLSRADIESRQRYLNARATLNELVQLGIVPIVNENDTIATDEIRLGDNDTLAGMVANLIDAELLIILTDQAGMYEQDPRKVPNSKLIDSAEVHDPALEEAAGTGSGALGRGGMRTKLQAARHAANSGASTVIASGTESDIILRICSGEQLGTLLSSRREPLSARQQWLSGLQPSGTIVIDSGAVKVLQHHGRSLLPIGVTAVKGEFDRGDMVSCQNQQGDEIARGLSNYNAAETDIIRGHSSTAIAELLGYDGEAELIHRNNLYLPAVTKS